MQSQTITTHPNTPNPEAIQALNAVSNSRLSFLNSIVAYNKSQAELLRAVGRPVASGL